MRITIHLTTDEVEPDVRRAIEVLRSANIPTDGGGTIGTEGHAIGAIILRNDADVATALETLARAGIKASA